MDPQALAEVAASQETKGVIGLLFFLVTRIAPIVLFIVAMFFHWTNEELKKRVSALEQKEQSNVAKRVVNHLATNVDALNSITRDLDKRFNYICSVTQRISESESQLTEKVEKMTASQLDTSLVALLNDGIVKELSKESESNPPPTV